METLHETIRILRNQLRLAMNGVTATSMREKGLRYKLNFGVSYPEIKAIAQQHEPNTTLAHALWAEDCRELKILATLLQPAQEFPKQDALRWIGEVPYPEIAEFLSKHLLAQLPYAEELATEIYSRTDLPFGRAIAFLTQAERLKNGYSYSSLDAERLLNEAISTLDSATNLFEQRAALQTLRFCGRQNSSQASSLLKRLEQHIQAQAEQSRWRDLYNDLKFEFDN